MEVICNHGRKNKSFQIKIMRIAHDWINVNLRNVLVTETMIASPDYMMQKLRARSVVLSEMIDKGEIGLVGAMYDVSTGKVMFYE